ncbi:ribosomal-protein-alanine acetyltransferase [Gordonia spumicola]|uniref:Ribosomal-protein-alanine acetyltransferase n=1 Tax=Gordonia spumicola TaxID=589161 RepID=A0A7I9V995_9ACTN|nr:ribosomal protein S18-alanine N-acetyltransferase [Gordonia spumicola]GEE01879.1 ribosomal-protein-alanine acetyltransferase [Gordonia spumicola]
MIVDALTQADLPRCAELEAGIFAGESPWPLSGFVAELRAPHNRYFAVRTAAGEPVAGYAGISVLGPEGGRECEIHTIAVDPDFLGRRFGWALLEAMLAVADAERAPVFLEVRTDNRPAIDLYERSGFVVVGTRRNYYQPSGADAYTMMRPAGGTSDQEERP